MHVTRLQTVIRNVIVSMDASALLNVSLNVRLQGVHASISYYMRSHFAVSHKPAQPNHLPPAATAAMLAFAFVHVASKTADKSLVNFNVAGKLLKGSGLHRLADSVKQKPRALLSHAYRTVNFIRANPILR